ncbi:NAD(P)/FAD-dependent oxidoreductase, partial [Sphingomonas adhaesiva]|uniref:NAD(P)/FAD-dependent oxidoreductase n=1 Tax=Sphingomonas adhaesiva TaxID=28212 RepID=UPI002FF75F6C
MLIVGGGPAGLTAAIYLARFHLSVVVADRGGGRATLIPRTRNHAGFPEGIGGAELVGRMRDQAARYGARLIDAEVTALVRLEDGFAAAAGEHEVTARAVLLATGVTNHRPAMDDAMHDAALARGLLRYCPICDGYEVTDRRVAVIGTGERGVREALFLRSYTADVTLIAPDGAHDLDAAARAALDAAGVAVAEVSCGPIALADDAILIGGRAFDTAYPAMGSAIHSGLARMLGAEVSPDGCMIVDAHQRTGVRGLYAAGDVVLGL